MFHDIQYVLYNYRKERLHCGILTALLVGFITYANLEPLLATDVDLVSEPAKVVLAILVINGSAVGVCLGLLLPFMCAGGCLGASAAFLVSMIGSSYTFWMEYPIVGPTFVAIGVGLTIGYVTLLFVQNPMVWFFDPPHKGRQVYSLDEVSWSYSHFCHVDFSFGIFLPAGSSSLPRPSIFRLPQYWWLEGLSRVSPFQMVCLS